MPVIARPIPRHLLIHSATHNYGVIANDAWGNPSWPHTRQLTHVRFEPSGKLVKTKDNNEIQLSALMFYDERNSSPQGVDFAFGDQLMFGGKPYSVVLVDCLYGGAVLHHKEIGLV